MVNTAHPTRLPAVVTSCRHQSDVFHAYQVLVAGGYRPDHIVVMAYDDIANNPENPMPGKVFNKPVRGPDVYSGVRIDYKGEQVNAANFLAVLEGNAAAVANKGSGRVLASGPSDKVFLFYSDHGAAGVLGMPSGPFLYADELLASIRRKFQRHGFKEMVMYIEACESGSMFEGLLDSNMAAYVTTAANAYESSWATYCPEFFGAASAGTNARPFPFFTCLGDLYSVAWLEDAEASDLTRESLLQQYKAIKRRTSQNFTYEQGSHVMQYGALDIDKE
ncbi:vacuolar processing enzyme 1b, partial [Scenedesmus sp. NREL 46B-D3]